MTTTQISQSPAELENRVAVKPAELAATLHDYAKTGGAISFKTITTIFARNSFDGAAIADSLGDCLHGLEDQLTRKFPEDAQQWARLAVEIVRDLSGEALSRAQSSISAERVQELIVKCGLLAIDFHRTTGNKASTALETGHLLTILKRDLHPSSEFGDLSCKRAG